MAILFVFLDGVGLGAPDPDANPFARFSLPAFERLGGGTAWTDRAPAFRRDDHVFLPIDATLEVDGLPQSGTGQATLFTGVNCARVAGRHFGPFPHSKTKPVIAEENLFRKIQALGNGHTARFANAYPDRFFEYALQRDRWTVTTLCCIEAGVPLFRYEDWKAGRALTADLTARGWIRLGYPDLVPISLREAGARLAGLGRRHALVLFEYFFTDKAGHSQSMAQAERRLRDLDAFFESLLREMDPERDLLVVTSDHGNLEDLSTKSHTRNPVPLIALGRGAGACAGIRSLTGVTPALVGLLAENGQP